MLIRNVRDLDVLLLLPLLVAEEERRKYFSITSTSAIISIHSLHLLRCLWHRLHGLQRVESWGKKKKRDERRTRQRELFATDIFGGISFVFIFSLHFKNETLVMSAQLSSSSLLIPSLFSLTSSTTSSYVYWWWFSSSLSFSPSFPVFLAHDDHEEREREREIQSLPSFHGIKSSSCGVKTCNLLSEGEKKTRNRPKQQTRTKKMMMKKSKKYTRRTRRREVRDVKFLEEKARLPKLKTSSDSSSFFSGFCLLVLLPSIFRPILIMFVNPVSQTGLILLSFLLLFFSAQHKRPALLPSLILRSLHQHPTCFFFFQCLSFWRSK